MGKQRRNQKFYKKKKNTVSINKKKRNGSETVNKKSIFNRYKNKQRVDEELAKKKRLEDKLKQNQVTYSESEEDEDPYELLVASFSKKPNKVQVLSESDSEHSHSSADETESHANDDVAESQERDDEPHEVTDDMEKFHKKRKNAVSMNKKGKQTEASEKHLENKLKGNQVTYSESEEEEEDPDESNEPFVKHLEFDLGDGLLVALSSSPPIVDEFTRSWPVLGNLIITIPKPLQTAIKSKIMIVDENPCARPGTVPNIIDSVDYNLLHIKSQIHGNIVAANKSCLIKRDLELTETFTPLQKELFSIMNNYQDLYYPERTFSNADEIRFIYCLHVVNHMLKTRTKILHHNAKLSKSKNVLDEFRDQGLVRPKVLILVPFKDAAYRIVKTLIDILVPKESGQVVNKSRFEKDFTGGELLMPKKNPKPEDYELLFSGNIDDNFRLGLTLTKKTLKLYTNFYSSDIIIASPLGLRMLIGAEGEEERDYDFLASIEMLVLDQSDVFLMQNWDHLLHVLEHMHLQPKKMHGADISRVRLWAAEGWTKYYRQTLMFSSVALPEISAVLNRKCQNYAGKVFALNRMKVGHIQHVVTRCPHIFHRFDSPSPVATLDARFELFVKEVLPKFRDDMMSHTLIYVPTYCDYLRIRNHFKKEDIGFVQVCEYSKDAKVARARDMFFHTEAHFLLYSERAHFFRRFRIKGIRHVIFYQPPTYPHFYAEMCNLMLRSYQNKYGGSDILMSVTTLYSKYDLYRISAIVGTNRTADMSSAEKSVQMYMTGE